MHLSGIGGTQLGPITMNADGGISAPEGVHVQVLKYKRALKACIPCRNAKVGCDHQRPCFRCTKHGIQSSCLDAPRRPRTGKKPKAQEASPPEGSSPNSSPPGDNSPPPNAPPTITPITAPQPPPFGTLVPTNGEPTDPAERSIESFRIQLQQQLRQQQDHQQQNLSRFQQHHQQIQSQTQSQHPQQAQQQPPQQPQQQPQQSQPSQPPPPPQQPQSQQLPPIQQLTSPPPHRQSQQMYGGVPPSPASYLASLLDENMDDSGSMAGGFSHDFNSQNPSVQDAISSIIDNVNSPETPGEKQVGPSKRELDRANEKIEQLSARIAQMDMNIDYLMNFLRTQGVDKYVLPTYSAGTLPSYLDPSHPLNSIPHPLAVFDSSQKLMVDCNPPFANLLGYESVTDLVLGSLVTLPDLITPRYRSRAIATCSDAIAKKLQYFERPAIMMRKDGSEIRVFLEVMHKGMQFFTRIRQTLPMPPHPSQLTPPIN